MICSVSSVATAMNTFSPLTLLQPHHMPVNELFTASSQYTQYHCPMQAILIEPKTTACLGQFNLMASTGWQTSSILVYIQCTVLLLRVVVPYIWVTTDIMGDFIPNLILHFPLLNFPPSDIQELIIGSAFSGPPFSVHPNLLPDCAENH